MAVNLLGTIVIALALQIGSSEIRLVALPTGATAICRENRALIVFSPNGSIGIGTYCPPTLGQNAAIVKTDHPRVLVIGFVLLLLSSALGILWGEGPEERLNRAERRRQMRLALKPARRRN
jgi:hypothetical protein